MQWLSRVVALAVVAATIAATAPATDQCPVVTGRTGFGPWNRTPWDLAVRGSLVFASDRTGLSIYDAGNPDAPALFGEAKIPGGGYGLAVNDSLAVVESRTGLEIYSVTDPSHPQLVGRFPGCFRGPVVLDGPLVFAPEDSGGIAIIDVQDPSEPTLAGEVGTFADNFRLWVTGMAASNDLLLVGIDGGIPEVAVVTVYDVSDPAHPVKLAQFPGVQNIHELAVSPGVAYVVDEQERLAIFDLTDPSHPVLRSSLPLGDRPTGLALAGRRAFLILNRNDLVAVDVADPGTPHEAGRITIPGGATCPIAVGGPLAAVRSPSGLALVRVGDPSALQVIGAIDAGSGYTNQVAVNGAIAVVADGASGLQIIDVSEPGAPRTVGHLELAGDQFAVAISGTTVLAGGNAGLAVIDISQPAAPRPLTTYAVNGDVTAVAVRGDVAFIGTVNSFGPEGLETVDIRDPEHPVRLGFLEIPAVQSVAVRDGLALLASSKLRGDGGLTIVDTSNAALPRALGSVKGLEATAVAVSGATALVVTSGGVLPVDISDPASPAVAGPAFGSRVGAVAVDNSVAFVTSPLSYDSWNSCANPLGVEAWDVINWYHPIALGSVETGTTGSTVALDGEGGRLWIGEGADVAEVDVSCLMQQVSAPPVAAIDWTPEEAHAGDPVRLVDASSGRPESWSWNLGDGSTATERNPVHMWDAPGRYTVTLTVSNTLGSDTASREIEVLEPLGPPLAEAGPQKTLVPAAASKPGLNGTSWVTDLTLLNPGESPVEATVYLLPGGQAGNQRGPLFTVPAHGQLVLDDVVGKALRAPGAKGALLIASGAPLAIGSRTYNRTESGTYGQMLPGFSEDRWVAAGQEVRLLGLVRNQRFRTNIGLAAPEDMAVHLHFALYRGDSELIRRVSYATGAYSFYQKTDILSEEVDNAYAVVTCDDPGARYEVYASVVDNQTGDAVTHAQEATAAAAGETLLVPAAAHLRGFGGADWRTDLVIHDPGTAPATVAVEVLPRADWNGAPPPPLQVIVEPAHSVRLDDLLGDRFAFEGAAALRLRVEEGTVMATSRTYNHAPAGDYGQLVPAVDLAGEAAGVGTRLLPQLVGPPFSRTDVGALATGDRPVTVRIQVFGCSGELLGARSLDLEPGVPVQINRFLHAVAGDVESAYAEVSPVGNPAPFVTWASVVDEATGDPVFILGR